MGRKNRRQGGIKKCGRPAPPGMSYLLWKIGVRDFWICWICQQHVSPTEESPRRRPTKDHLIPLSRGGPSMLWNFRIAHSHCNEVRDSSVPPPRVVLLMHVDSTTYNGMTERFRQAYGYEFSAHQD